MRNYIPIAEVEARDLSWADRIREFDKLKKRRLSNAKWRNSRASYMLQHIGWEAKRKNVKFELTLEWFKTRLESGLCELSGLPFDLESKKMKNSPSVDRKVAGGHYTPENCRMILYSLNAAISDVGEDYIINVFEHVIARRKG